MSESVAFAEVDGATRALAELATSDAASPAEAPKPKATSLFKKKKGKKAFGSKAVLEAPPKAPKPARAPAPAAATSAASFAASARRAADIGAQNNCSLEALAVALHAARPFTEAFGRAAPGGSGPDADAVAALRLVFAGVGRREAPSGPNEALRQALASRGGGDLARAFGYADAAEVFETLVRALDGGGAPGAAAALKTDGYALVKMPCLICGGDEEPYQPPTSIASVVCVAQDVVRLHAEEPEAAFHDLVRRSRAPEPLSCPVTGERTVAVAARAAAPARVLALNLNWASTGARHDDVAAVLRGALCPLDARRALADGTSDDDGEPDVRTLVAVVCFCADHYTAYVRPPPSVVDLDYPPSWTCHDRFLETGAGLADWLVDQVAPPPDPPNDRLRPKLPSLLFYV